MATSLKPSFHYMLCDMVHSRIATWRDVVREPSRHRAMSPTTSLPHPAMSPATCNVAGDIATGNSEVSRCRGHLLHVVRDKHVARDIATGDFEHLAMS